MTASDQRSAGPHPKKRRPLPGILFAGGAALLFLACLAAGAMVVIRVTFGQATRVFGDQVLREDESIRNRRHWPREISSEAWSALQRHMQHSGPAARGDSGWGDAPLRAANEVWSVLDLRRLWWTWGALAAAALGWTLLNVHWGQRALHRIQGTTAFIHFSVATASGLVALGMQGTLIAQAWTTQPVIWDLLYLAPPTSSPPAPSAQVAIAGNAVEGKRLFAMTCLTCHGATGDGLAGLAPSLRTSDWIRGADEASIARVIRHGRAISDPDNRSGKVMPARGGNPFLTDEQIAHLAAFVQSLPAAEGAARDAGESDTPALPPPTLARWVVPAPPDPPVGFIGLDSARHAIGVAYRPQLEAWRAERWWQGGSLLLALIHGLGILGVLLVFCQAIFARLLGVTRSVAPQLVWAARGWWLAFFSWLAILALAGWSL